MLVLCLILLILRSKILIKTNSTNIIQMNTLRLALLAVVASITASCVRTNISDCSPYANKVVETMMQRRSIRHYESRAVARDTLDIILECGINAPNGLNRQPWEVRVVDDPSIISDISRIYKMYNNELANQIDFVNMFRNAPTVVFIATHSDHKGDIECGILAQNITLSAWSMGVGSCILRSPVKFLNKTPEAATFLKRLNLPPDYELTLCVALGYPTEWPDAKPRNKNKIKYIN